MRTYKIYYLDRPAIRAGCAFELDTTTVDGLKALLEFSDWDDTEEEVLVKLGVGFSLVCKSRGDSPGEVAGTPLFVIERLT